MRVRIHIGLDLDGFHTLQWEPNDSVSAVEVPLSTLERWTAEREAFHIARRRWQRISEEVEDALYGAERTRAGLRGAPTHAPASSGCRSFERCGPARG